MTSAATAQRCTVLPSPRSLCKARVLSPLRYFPTMLRSADNLTILWVGGGKQLTQVNNQLNQDQVLQETAVLFIVQFLEVRSKLMHWLNFEQTFTDYEISQVEYFDTAFCSPQNLKLLTAPSQTNSLAFSSTCRPDANFSSVLRVKSIFRKYLSVNIIVHVNFVQSKYCILNLKFKSSPSLAPWKL